MPGEGRKKELAAMRPRGTPVPIPNTMVKTRAADDTAPQGAGKQEAAGRFKQKERKIRKEQGKGTEEKKEQGKTDSREEAGRPGKSRQDAP